MRSLWGPLRCFEFKKMFPKFAGNRLNFSLMKKIRLFITALMTLVATTVMAQNITVTGTVTDTGGNPLPGTAVYVSGTTTGTLTDDAGHYSVTVPSNASLTFSILGYKVTAVEVAGRRVINVSLEDDSTMLDETIVVAFGTSTREAFTGSATVVNSEKLSKSQVSNAVKAIEGKVAGVQMTTSSGTLGTNPTVIVRGYGSIGAANGPLYVVDGVPFSGDMNNINPADIESITVQKDAASNALYGARGANGVIMITTKKAKAGEAVVNVDAKWGVNTKALQDYDIIKDPAEFYETRYNSLYNYYRLNGKSDADANSIAASIVAGPSASGGTGYQVFTIPEGQYFIGTNGKVNPNAKLGRYVEKDGVTYYLTGEDWMKETYKRSLRQEYNVNVSGTTGKASVLASFGYLNDKGIVDAADMYRYTARVKTDYQAKPWLKVGANATYSKYNYNNGNSDEGESGSTGNIFSFAALMPTIYPVYIRTVGADGTVSILKDANGFKRYDFGEGSNAGFTRPNATNANPLQTLTLNENNTEGNAMYGTGYAEVSLPKNFKFTFNAGFGLDEWRSTAVLNMYYGQFVPDGGIVEKEHSRRFYYNLQELLSWSETFGGAHNVSVMAGHENYDLRTYELGAYKKNMFSLENDELNSAVVDGKGSYSSRTQYLNEGWFLRALYDWDGRVYANASVRRDASSRFHPSHRWGNFWSLGAGWLLNKESWFNVDWVDMLKFKASIGSLGNDGLPSSYLYTDTSSLSNNDGNIAIAPGQPGNENITWETNTNFNTGFDFELLNGRIAGSLEYFYRKTTDMLYFFSVPTSLGYSGKYDNMGDMRNSGLELAIDATVVRTRDWNVSVNANITHFKNKVLRLPEKNKTQTVEGHEGYIDGSRFVAEGLPRFTYYMRQFAGVDKENGKALWYMDETNDDGELTGNKVTTDLYSEATRYLCGDPTPAAYGGFGVTAQWKNIDFSAQFTYQLGGKCYDSGYAQFVASPGNGNVNNVHRDVLKAWTPDNKESDFPRFVYLDQYFNSQSDRFLISARYLNFQNVQLGYTLPAKLTEKIKISRLRIYATADNIWYVSARKGLDPRYSLTGGTNHVHNSPVRTISGGINVTF